MFKCRGFGNRFIQNGTSIASIALYEVPKCILFSHTKRMHINLVALWLKLTIKTIADTPEVALRMSPSSPISELDRRNVTLFCDVISGNPDTLNSVKWFMDGVLLKQLPMCHNELEYDIIDGDHLGNNDEDDLCDIDPSKLLLEHVTKLFHGNFSCEATNDAGWSERSSEKQLEIYCK